LSLKGALSLLDALATLMFRAMRAVFSVIENRLRNQFKRFMARVSPSFSHYLLSSFPPLQQRTQTKDSLKIIDIHGFRR
jgi:hypothetical protein